MKRKITKTKYLTVNKRMAPSIQAMFAEIYKSKEKQVIKDIGSYKNSQNFVDAVKIARNYEKSQEKYGIFYGSFGKT